MSRSSASFADGLGAANEPSASIDERAAHQDWLLDQALLGTYPASDPISVSQSD
jgi:hypothetical protein